MRKTSVRRFIHAILDVLPLLIIPIFAININQKSVEPIQVEVQEKISVDFNQLIQKEGMPSTTTTNGITFTNNNNGTITIDGTSTDRAVYTIYTSTHAFDCILNHKYYIKLFNETNTIGLQYGITLGSWIGTNQNYIFTATGTNNYQFWIAVPINTQVSMFNITPQVFDLTQMFGSGNEPTVTEFNNIFTNIYYNYETSQKMLVNKPTLTTYDDTDIGSQFLYSLYKPVQDYFNFNNLFNMGQIYDWIQLNLFSGTAPLPIFIIWNIIVYEFFVDLIFLMYSLFMFIIDWSTNMIDKFLYKSRS